MTQRVLVVLGAVAVAVAVGGAAWRLTRPEPVITEERALSIRAGMTRGEVEAMLGGPPGDYAGGAVVTYARGTVGADESGYFEGTNWWGAKGMIQVQLGKDGVVESAAYFPANWVGRADFWGGLWAGLAPSWPRNRHGWVAAAW